MKRLKNKWDEIDVFKTLIVCSDNINVNTSLKPEANGDLNGQNYSNYSCKGRLSDYNYYVSIVKNTDNKRKEVSYPNKRLYDNRDIQMRIRERVSERIRRELKRYQLTKEDHTEYYISCTVKEYIKHVESQWLEGMTWDNYGFYGWHMDHIIPVILFDLRGEVELKMAFHYRNIQPLWGKDNLSKSG